MASEAPISSTSVYQHFFPSRSVNPFLMGFHFPLPLSSTYFLRVLGEDFSANFLCARSKLFFAFCPSASAKIWIRSGGRSMCLMVKVDLSRAVAAGMPRNPGRVR
jgi:hypothetical protein